MGFRNATGFMSLYSKNVKYKLVKACMYTVGVIVHSRQYVNNHISEIGKNNYL